MKLQKITCKKVLYWLTSIFIINSFFHLVGCQSEDKAFLYETEFKAYIDSTFSIQFPNKETTYFIMPLSSCEYCTQKTHEVLNDLSFNKDIILILIGSNNISKNDTISFFFHLISYMTQIKKHTALVLG